MNYYWYFWLGFSAVGLLWLPSFVRLVRKAHKLSSWKETYRKECENEEGSELKTIKDIDDFYDEKKSQSYLGRKFLLEKKAYLLSKINEVEQKKEFAKDMIPLLVQSILPEIISLFFLGINAEKLPNYAFIVAIVVLALYLIAVFFFRQYEVTSQEEIAKT